MGFTWLEWLGQIIKMVGDLIPQRILVEPTHKAVKFKGMKKVVVLQPGRYWYIPFFSTYYSIPVVRQSIYTDEQDLTTLDGKPVKVRSVISYEVDDVETALCNCYEFSTQIDDEVMGIICRYFSKKKFSEIVANRVKVNQDITSQVNNRMKEYGISIKRVQLTSFTTGLCLLHTGINGKVNTVTEE